VAAAVGPRNSLCLSCRRQRGCRAWRGRRTWHVERACGRCQRERSCRCHPQRWARRIIAPRPARKRAALPRGTDLHGRLPADVWAGSFPVSGLHGLHGSAMAPGRAEVLGRPHRRSSPRRGHCPAVGYQGPPGGQPPDRHVCLIRRAGSSAIADRRPTQSFELGHQRHQPRPDRRCLAIATALAQTNTRREELAADVVHANLAGARIREGQES
jgi:hypothetical protein